MTDKSSKMLKRTFAKVLHAVGKREGSAVHWTVLHSSLRTPPSWAVATASSARSEETCERAGDLCCRSGFVLFLFLFLFFFSLIAGTARKDKTEYSETQTGKTPGLNTMNLHCEWNCLTKVLNWMLVYMQMRYSQNFPSERGWPLCFDWNQWKDILTPAAGGFFK